ncbi:MAG: ThiF family adenylyltransferase [Planctomycetes bacterium]|nr:ThiF family adenylyltransferase [Planctomycetota bacterium]
MNLSTEQRSRYARHIILPKFGLDAQIKLLGSHVFVVGAGGIGCPLLQYLAAAGVGKISLIDYDKVDPSNLQRQVLYGTADVGSSKALLAKKRLESMNPDVRVTAYDEALTKDNALDLFRTADLVIDGTDNFSTRYLVNDACGILGKLFLSGSVYRFEGQATLFSGKEGPCYRCLFPNPPAKDAVPDCSAGGVLGVLPGTIALILATEAIKVLAGVGSTLRGRLLVFDALTMKFLEFGVNRGKDCPTCGNSKTIQKLEEIPQYCNPQKEESEMTSSNEVKIIDVHGLRKLIDESAEFELIDVREPGEYEICRIQGSKLLPLGDVPSKFDSLEIPKDKMIVMQCHHGGRSYRAGAFAVSQGYTNVYNLDGGINAWSIHIDQSVPRY